MSDGEEPIAALILSIIGGVLILVDGALVASAASLVSGTSIPGSATYEAANFVATLGALSAFFGFLVILLGIGLYVKPEAHVGLGIAILILSLLSLVSGGGFILGLILGLIGGILAIVFQPPEEEIPVSWSVPSYHQGGPVNSGPVSLACPFCAGPYTPGTRVCDRCGARLPAYGIQLPSST